MNAGEPPPRRPRSYEAERKQRARDAKARHLQADPRHPGIVYSTLSACPHGTDYGYVEYGCRCLDLGPLVPDPGDPDGPPIPSGCGTVGPAAASARTKARKTRQQAAETACQPEPQRSSEVDPLDVLDEVDRERCEPPVERLDKTVRPSKYLPGPEPLAPPDSWPPAR